MSLDIAKNIALRLREAGHDAWLVGGCVRDLLLGRTPKDCDVSTSARPEQVRTLFPGSLLVGAHFGVVIVRQDGELIEIATYRSDGNYRDGRRPDQVTFETDVRKDLERRDFTINAMLLDPVSGEIVDLVGGRLDLKAQLIRAIGEPVVRFREDHLRLMRAVRFAARFGFTIEARTWAAICAECASIGKIAVERVKGELARILTEGHAARGMELLRGAGLLRVILPEAGSLDILGRLPSPGFELALASVLLNGDATRAVERLKLSNDERARVLALCENHSRFDDLDRMPVSALKRFLRMKDFDQHLELYRAAVAGDSRYESVRALRESMTEEILWPVRLLTGDDLKRLGVVSGPQFAELLAALEDEQLEGRVSGRREAEAFVRAAVSGGSST